MEDEKKKNIIIGILFFVMIGLIIAIVIVNNNKNNKLDEDKNKQTEKSDDKSDVKEPERSDIVVPIKKVTYESASKATKLVELAKESLLMDDYTKASLSVSKLKNGSTKTNLQTELENILNCINIDDEIKKLEEEAKEVKDKDTMLSARRNRDSLVALLDTVVYESVKERFQKRIDAVNLIVGNNREFVITGVSDGKYYNTDVTINVEDAEGLIVELNTLEFLNNSVVSDEGIYNLVVKDTYYNETTLTFTIDKTAPTIKYYDKIITSDLIVMPNLNDKIIFGEDTNLEKNYMLIDDSSEAIDVDLVHFELDKTYTYVSTDKAGNESKIKLEFNNAHELIQVLGDYSTLQRAYVNETRVRVTPKTDTFLVKIYEQVLTPLDSSGKSETVYNEVLNPLKVETETFTEFKLTKDGMYNIVLIEDGIITEIFLEVYQYKIRLNDDFVVSGSDYKYVGAVVVDPGEEGTTEYFVYDKETSEFVTNENFNKDNPIARIAGKYKVVKTYPDLIVSVFIFETTPTPIDVPETLDLMMIEPISNNALEETKEENPSLDNNEFKEELNQQEIVQE